MIFRNTVREPAVAGSFYPGNPEALKSTVLEYLSQSEAEPSEAIGIVSPHAGYVYSGATAGDAFSSLKVPSRAVILGPNHYGAGPRMSIMTNGLWRLPGFSIPIDEESAVKLLQNSKYLKADALAHLREHSIEVQLPFLYYSNPAVSFIPVSLYTHSSEYIEDLAASLAEMITSDSEDTLIVVSSDMSHYLSSDEAEKLDMMAIEKILSLDTEGFLSAVDKMNMSICGAGPVAVLMSLASKLGRDSAELIGYTTSGEVTGDYSEVVGYAGILFK